MSNLNIFFEILIPLLFLVCGVIFSSNYGRFRVSVEGEFLIAAFFTNFFAIKTQNVYLSIFLSLIISAFFATISFIIIEKFRINDIIYGIIFNVFALSFTSFLMESLAGEKGLLSGTSHLKLPILLPFLENNIYLSFFNKSILFYLGIILPIFSYYLLKKTGFGIKLRLVKTTSNILSLSGVNKDKYRLIGEIISSIFFSLAGSYLSLVTLSFFLGEFRLARATLLYLLEH